MSQDNTKKIVKSKPSTTSEGRLAKLGEKLFLSLWSYPSPYRDQGKANGREGKELCDLLTVFENQIFIFSDKNC